MGFIQESRSERSLEALSALVPHYAHLLRDSHLRTCLANVLVPGDIVTFSVGDRIPADVRLISSEGLEVDESKTKVRRRAEVTEPKGQLERSIYAVRSVTSSVGGLLT